MKRIPILLSLIVTIAVATSALGGTECCAKATTAEQSATIGKTPGDGVFGELAHQYLIIQNLLAGDSLEGVADASRALAQSASANAGADAATLGVEVDKATDARISMAESARAAASLANTTDLKQARNAFAELSLAMIKLRDVAEGDRPTVAFCSMAGKEWMQPQGPVANPYYGSSMLRCGKIVR